MTSQQKILFISQEVESFSSTGSNLSLDADSIIIDAVINHGCETRVFLPCYKQVGEKKIMMHEVQRLSGMNVIINDDDHPLIIKVASIPKTRLQAYFIDNDHYFINKFIVADKNGKEYEHNEDRVVFFARGVLETIKKLRWTPDVIHCYGWTSALAPLYIKKAYSVDPFFKNSKIVFSLHNEGFKDSFSKDFASKIIMPGVTEADLDGLVDKNATTEDLYKIAIKYSDNVIIGDASVSENLLDYAKDKIIESYL